MLNTAVITPSVRLQIVIALLLAGQMNLLSGSCRHPKLTNKL